MGTAEGEDNARVERYILRIFFPSLGFTIARFSSLFRAASDPIKNEGSGASDTAAAGRFVVSRLQVQMPAVGEVRRHHIGDFRVFDEQLLHDHSHESHDETEPGLSNQR